MEINRQNYEIYLLDYIEGNLPENMELAMVTFLKNNPDIENEAKDLADNVFAPDIITFNQKEKLKKNPLSDIPGISTFEQLSISYLENDISSEKLSELKKIIDLDESKRHEHQIIQKTKLIADSSEIYADKTKLKHIYAKTWFSKTRVYFAIAASIILLLSFSLLLRQNNHIEYGKIIGYKNYDFELRKLTDNQPTTKEIKVSETYQKTINSIQDSFEYREKTDLQAISNKSVAQINIPDNKEMLLIAENIPVNQTHPYYNDDADYKTIQTYLNEKFKEKVLKQNKNERVKFISVVNAFGRFTKKVFNRKIELEKTIKEDGTYLYALKTESYNLYTKRNPRDKEKTNDTKKEETPQINN